ncbi:MAG: hypothetical protein MJ214_01055 [Bacilli bacterium]|nr:hypothetical protein [Bacilli bacterium]
MNKKILTPLFVAVSFLLIGCSTSEIIGRPDWIDDPIVVDPTDLKDNTMKVIYDAIKKLGDTNANVLNKVIYDIAKKQIGTFDELTKFSKLENKGNSEFKAFVEAHSIYQPDKKSAIKKGGTITVKELADLTDAEKNDVSYGKIKQQYDTIVERIFEKLYNEVKGGSYTIDSVRKLFSEKEFVRHLKKEFYAPKDAGIGYFGKQVFTPKPIGMTWKEFVNTTDNTETVEKKGFLHIMDTTGNLTELYYPKTEGEDGGYIGRKILPDIYHEVLIEKYVREQRYTNLGRGYARKAQMIKIDHSSYDGEVRKMLNEYAKLHITGGGETVTKATYGSLDDLNSAMIGVADAEEQKTNWSTIRKYLEAGEFPKINIDDTSTNQIVWAMHIDENGEPTTTPKTTYVFRGTKLGDLVEKFKKAYDLIPGTTTKGANFTYTPKSPFTEEAKTAYNELTNNGAYPIEVGLEIKERELLSTDLTQDGWYMKDGGLTDLHEDFRNRLFNISTSNIIDEAKKMETDERGWSKDYESGDYARYFESTDMKGATTKHAYIVDSLVSPDKAWESVVLNKDNNFYIVQVDEAASLAKLSLDDERAYIRLKATENIADSNNAMNEIVRDITRQVGSSDTYKKNAEQYYLMISNILFYDQSVYDYFKSQFPDLFK